MDQEEEYYNALIEAREELMHNAEVALCNGLSKEQWLASDYVKKTRDKIWWMEYSDVYYIAEYVWEYYSDFFEDKDKWL